MIMIIYGILIVSLFLLLILGAGWLFRKREREYEDELEQMRKETDYLRDKVNTIVKHININQ